MSNAMGIAAHPNRGQQFTVGNISNGLIYLRYYPTICLHISFLPGSSVYIGLGEEAQLLASNLGLIRDALFYNESI